MTFWKRQNYRLGCQSGGVQVGAFSGLQVAHVGRSESVEQGHSCLLIGALIPSGGIPSQRSHLQTPSHLELRLQPTDVGGREHSVHSTNQPHHALGSGVG